MDIREPPRDPSLFPIDAGGTPRRRAEAEDDYRDDSSRSSSAGASGWSSSAGMSSSSTASIADASFESASFDMDDILPIPRRSRSRSRSIGSPDNIDIDGKISAALDAFVTKCQKRTDSNLEWVHLVNAIKEKNRKSNDPLLGKIMSGSEKDNNSNQKTVGQSRACNDNKNGQEGQYVVSLSSGVSSTKPPVAAGTEASAAVAQTARAREKVKKFLQKILDTIT